MPNGDLRDEVRTVIAELIAEPLDPNDDEVVLSGAHTQFDSLAVLDAVGAVEQRFEVSIDLVEDDLRRTFASVRTITELVAAKRADGQALAALSWEGAPQ